MFEHDAGTLLPMEAKVVEHHMLERIWPDSAPAKPSDEAVLEAEKKKKKKKKDKIRSAWISFTGRIVSQIVGAVATVALGITVLHNHKAAGGQPGGTDATRAEAALGSAQPDSQDEISVAVLPIENFSGDAAQDYFADGMTEALITSLSKIESLHVISRTSSMHFKGQRKPLREMAQQLGAGWIVEGSVARAGGRVRITAQLIDAGVDEHVWAEEYDRPVTDILEVQAEVAGAITRAICAALPPHQQ